MNDRRARYDAEHTGFSRLGDVKQAIKPRAPGSNPRVGNHKTNHREVQK